jgi:superfamily II DNA/RNA helicase
LVNTVRDFVESLGYSVGEYVGDTDNLAREKVKKQFIAGEIDILVGSRAISVGVDGLQQRCNQLILLSLPWTHAAYVQVVGRVYRQGGAGTVQIVIPQVVVGCNGDRWSWDEARMKHIESKRTLAECATDGVIPTTSTLSRKILALKAIEALNKLSKNAKG